MSKLINGNLWLEANDIGSRLEGMDCKDRWYKTDVLKPWTIVPTGHQMFVYSFHEIMDEIGRLVTFIGADVNEVICSSFYVGDDFCVGDDFVFVKVLEFSKPQRATVVSRGDKPIKFYGPLNRIMVINYKNKPEEVKL